MSIAPAETARRGPGIVASVRRRQAHYPVAQVVALVALFAYGAATLDGFASRRSIYSMLVLAALLGIATAGQTLCVLSAASTSRSRRGSGWARSCSYS